MLEELSDNVHRHVSLTDVICVWHTVSVNSPSH